MCVLGTIKNRKPKRTKWRNYHIIATLLVLISTVDSKLSYLPAFGTWFDEIFVPLWLWARKQNFFSIKVNVLFVVISASSYYTIIFQLTVFFWDRHLDLSQFLEGHQMVGRWPIIKYLILFTSIEIYLVAWISGELREDQGCQRATLQSRESSFESHFPFLGAQLNFFV